MREVLDFPKIDEQKLDLIQELIERITERADRFRHISKDYINSRTTMYT